MFISEVAYELYKQNWIDSHTTPELRLQVISDYYNYVQETMKDEDCEDFQDYNSLEEYIYDNGYPNGEMYVCFDEFLDNEFQDKEYMKELLSVELYADYLLVFNHMNKEEKII